MMPASARSGARGMVLSGGCDGSIARRCCSAVPRACAAMPMRPAVPRLRGPTIAPTMCRSFAFSDCSLLHFIAAYLEATHPAALELPEELAPVRAASRLMGFGQAATKVSGWEGGRGWQGWGTLYSA